MKYSVIHAIDGRRAVLIVSPQSTRLVMNNGPVFKREKARFRSSGNPDTGGK